MGKAINESMENLKTDYIDSFLIHSNRPYKVSIENLGVWGEWGISPVRLGSKSGSTTFSWSGNTTSFKKFFKKSIKNRKSQIFAIF